MGAQDPTHISPIVSVSRSPWKVRYFLDTEFTDFKDTQLISLAIVGENGDEFYGELTDFEKSACSDFVREIVLPQLGQFPHRIMSRALLRSELLAWLHGVPLKPKPILCFDYSGDIDLVCDLIGGPLPRGWKHENIYLRVSEERMAEYFAQHGGEHHALHDTRATRLPFK